MARPGEFDLIERYFAPLAPEDSFSLRDDAALVRPSEGSSLVVTQDAIAAKIHFFADDPPDTIARKALRVNLSDLAAKGAVPSAFSMALGLPSDWTEEWLAGFARGLAEDCRLYGVSLAGGDTFRVDAGPVIAITAWGTIRASDYAARMAGGPGEDLYVTGRIGEGALGLLVRTGKASFGDADPHLLQRYLVPAPPVAFAPAIAGHAAAAIDISDGLIGDLGKLAAASALDFEIRLGDVPLTAAAMIHGDAGHLKTALTGGDDYQLAFTADPAQHRALQRKASDLGIELSRLGAARRGEGRVRILDDSGRPLDLGGGSYSHF